MLATLMAHGAVSRAVVLELPTVLKKRSSIRTCHLPPGPSRLWGPGGVPGEWSDVCGFFKPPGSDADWQIRNHGAITIPYNTLDLRESDQSCHHEVWIHHLHFNARLVDRISREDKQRRPISRKRNSPCDHSKERR